MRIYFIPLHVSALYESGPFLGQPIHDEGAKLGEFLDFLKGTLLPETAKIEGEFIKLLPFKHVHEALYDAQRNQSEIVMTSEDAIKARTHLSTWFSKFDPEHFYNTWTAGRVYAPLTCVA